MALFIGAPLQCVLKQILRRPSLTSALMPIFQQSTSVDAIEAFTNNLMKDREIKWKLLEMQCLEKIERTWSFKDEFAVAARSIATDLKTVTRPDAVDVDVRQLNCKQLDNLILSSLDSQDKSDFFYLIGQCLKWELLPSAEATLKILRHLSLLGKTEVIEGLVALLEKSSETPSIERAKLAAFKGVALWKSGKIDSGLKTLSSCYNFPLSKRSSETLHSALRLISEETLKFKSEAALVNLLKFAEEINKEFRDIFLIGCIWKNCFESEWFSDQKVANNLFEDSPQLRATVYESPSSLCYSFLMANKVDAVHRFIELLLKNEQKSACKVCLNILFEYNYWRQDLRACGEIIKSSLELEIPLAEDKSQKLLNLLLNKPILLAKKPTVQKFQFKF